MSNGSCCAGITHRVAGWQGGPVFLMLAMSGCGLGGPLPPAPFGPGSAAAADLTPWLVTAIPVRYTGTLLYFNVASQKGSYCTWALAPAGPYSGAELDVRHCPAAAARLLGLWVTVDGKLIDRGERHRPLMVVVRIALAESVGIVLPFGPPQRCSATRATTR